LVILTKITAKSQEASPVLPFLFPVFCRFPNFQILISRAQHDLFFVFLHKVSLFFCVIYKKQIVLSVILSQIKSGVNVYYCQMSKQTLIFCAFYKKIA